MRTHDTKFSVAMKSKSVHSKPEFTLGIEGGGTRTAWTLLNPSGRVARRGTASAGNTLLLSDAKLASLLHSIRTQAGSKVDAIGAGFAGCNSEVERGRVRRAVRKIWPQAHRVVVAGDTESALAGAHGQDDGICVIAGTGSNVVGRSRGKVYKAGGWGHLFSDQGSGYDLARRGLEAAYRHYDATEKVGPLGHAFLRATGQNSLEKLVPWILQRHDKTEVASLSPAVFQAARQGDPLAKALIRSGAQALAEHVGFLVRRLKLKKPPIGLVGGLFEKEPIYQRAFRQALRKISPGSFTPAGGPWRRRCRGLGQPFQPAAIPARQRQRSPHCRFIR
jgi:N-acetylmuramic acid 6-phosphate etherase